MCDSTGNNINEVVQVVVMIVTSATALIAVVALWITVRQFKRQLHLSFFSDYTKRYQEIMLNFPENINEPVFDLSKLDKNTREKTLRYMRAYFDLCSEEYYLSQQNNIDKNTWNEWKSGIEYAFSKRAFQICWELVSLDSAYYKEFSDFVNGIIEPNT